MFQENPYPPCWQCRQEVTGHFCDACGAVQPLLGDSFRLLGLDARLQVDVLRLEETFHALSRRFHPDFYQQKSAQEQAISLENAATLNAAYRTLKDPDRRMAYLIHLVTGGLVAGGAVEEKTAVPTAFLDEILDVEEALAVLRASPDDGVARSTLRAAQAVFTSRTNEVNQALAALSAAWDDQIANDGPVRVDWTPVQRAWVARMKAAREQRAYLDRVLSGIASALGA